MLRVKNQNLKYFDGKLRFALLASLSLLSISSNLWFHSKLASIFFDIPSLQSVSSEKCHVLRQRWELIFLSVLSISFIILWNAKNRSAANPPKPMYEMDESKLLIPVLPWGAAEQMRGFRESLLMGFFMNRTVCVPPFWRERSPSAFKVAL